MRERYSWRMAGAVYLAWALFGPVTSLAADEIVRGRSVDTWLRVLRDRSSTDRVLAIVALCEIGAKDPRVVPALTAVATDRNYGCHAIHALAALGEDARQAVPMLNAVMSQSADVLARITAAEALWQIAKDPRVVPGLAAVATDPQYGCYVIGVLGRLGKDARQVAPMLIAIMSETADAPLRITAAEALWRIARQPECIDALIQCLDDPNMHFRAEAATALGRIGPPAGKATIKLVRLLGHHEVWVRVTAVEAIGLIRSEPRSTAPALIKALRDPWSCVRSNAAEALASFGGEAASALPALERATKDEDAIVRVEAAYALWCVGKRPFALKLLYAAVAETEFEEQDASVIAIQRLAQIGSGNKEVAPRLLEFLSQGHRHRVEIATALWELNRRSEALAALSAALEDKQLVIRRVAAMSLRDLGPEARSAAPALLKALARMPDQDQLAPETDADAQPSIAEPATLSNFESCRFEAWMALQAIDPAAAARYRSEHPDAILAPAPSN